MADLQLDAVKPEPSDSQLMQFPSRISRSNEKKFICNYLPGCHAAFSRQEHLQRHIRKHTGERPFSCGCGRTFTRLDNLRQHAQTVHSGTEMANITEEQTAIALATKMRPTPNSPPPRVDGGSDTDPYPRPVSKIAKHSAPTTRESSLEVSTPPPPPAVSSVGPPTPHSTHSTPAKQDLMTPARSPYDTVTFTPPVTDRPVPQQNVQVQHQQNHSHPQQPQHHQQHNHQQYHHQHQQQNHQQHNQQLHQQNHHQQQQGQPTFHNPMQQSFNAYQNMHQNMQQSAYSNQYYPPPPQFPDVESSVGSQPISSLAKRRTPKSDFVYTGGGGLLNMNRAATAAANAAMDDGETMSEYINNGHEPKLTGGRGETTQDGAAAAELDSRLDPDGLEAMNMLSELAAARRD